MRTGSGHLFCAIALLASIAVAGCKRIECGPYEKYLNNGQMRDSVLTWSDNNVLGKDVSSLQLGGGRLVGPGRRSIRVDGSLAPLPEGLAGKEVRLLGADERGVAAIFIGEHSFRGLVVTRDKVSDFAGFVRVPPQFLESSNDRTALLCYQED